MSKAQSVDDFLDALSHKRIGDIRALRQIVLGADPAITEQIKWNAPSFCWEGKDCITMRLHPGDRLELVFHRGAKVVDNSGFNFDDPTGRITWATADRGVLLVIDPLAEREEILALVEGWIVATGGAPTN